MGGCCFQNVNNKQQETIILKDAKLLSCISHHHDSLPGDGFLTARQWARIQAKKAGPTWPGGKQILEQLMGLE